MKEITIFTPTYNRAYILPELYDSLKKQTNKNFVWLIVDDGSTDNTKELVESWIEEKEIEIEYHYKENGGKNSAIDFSNGVCKTEYIACVDSDDSLAEDAVDVIYGYLEAASDEDVVGLVFRRAHLDGSPFSENWPDNNAQKLFFYELGKNYNYFCDTFLVFKTAIIRDYHFPVFEGERFVTESVYYNQFLYTYRLLACKDLIYYSEYRPDGYTKMGIKLFENNPRGYLYSLLQNAYISIYVVKETLKRRIINIASYYAWKKLFNLKDDTKEYKIGLFYRLCGRLFTYKLLSSYKKQLIKK